MPGYTPESPVLQSNPLFPIVATVTPFSALGSVTTNLQDAFAHTTPEIQCQPIQPTTQPEMPTHPPDRKSVV